MNVYRFRPGQPVVWYDRRPARSNHWCLYCGEYVGPDSTTASDREHLIGRNFVPAGTLRGDSFNFHFRACCECNRSKSVLEDHVSSVSLFTSPARAIDPAVNGLAQQKAAGSIHPRERGPDGERVRVQDAYMKRTLSGELMPGVQVSFDLVGPPQFYDLWVHALARHHVQAFFSLITSLDPTQAETTRFLPPDQCFVYRAFRHQDWGNAELLDLARRTARWSVLAQTDTADGYFRAKFLRVGGSGTEWFWALEWNKALRVVGSLASPGAVPPLFLDLVEARHARTQSGWHVKKEVPLSPADDTLFDWADVAA